jgi:hypothetical protein
MKGTSGKSLGNTGTNDGTERWKGIEGGGRQGIGSGGREEIEIW